ncbi:ribonucleotide reductase R2 subunit variant [Mycena metata]|uniref:Ribonucleotide reductase R2 subunit variant n=1 Tax=Mycena metata TaxID=1033252 RepID=A0AAD7N0Z6_9AGAR|nr:ribonucleotide reductase R2 subunit variant [Mycena metata]
MKASPNLDDPLLRETERRFIWDLYKHAQSCFWTAEEMDVSKDVADWDNVLTDKERRFVSHVLVFMAASADKVNENLVARFSNEIQVAEARCFYGFQMMMDNVHSEMYSVLIDTYIRDHQERDTLVLAIGSTPCVARRAEWATKWMEPKDASFSQRLVAFAALRGILFSGSVAAIFWLKKRGLLPALALSIDLINRDERLHTDFACLLFKHLRLKADSAVVLQIIQEAVSMEQEFTTVIVPAEVIGLDAALITTYVEFVADRLLSTLGLPKLYNSVNPFDFVGMASTPSLDVASYNGTLRSTISARASDGEL